MIQPQAINFLYLRFAKIIYMKIVFTLLITAFLCQSGFSQTKFGVFGGYTHNSARIHYKDKLQETSYVPGFNFGARVQVEFEPPLYFTGIFGFSRRGYNYKPTADSSVKTGINYIDIAPMVNYDFNIGAGNKISLLAGPMLGVAFAGKEKTTVNGSSTTSDMKFSLSGNYSYANLAAQAGIGFHFNNFFIEGIYHLGLNSINSDEEQDDTNIKLRGFTFNIGYWIK